MQLSLVKSVHTFDVTDNTSLFVPEGDAEFPGDLPQACLIRPTQIKIAVVKGEVTEVWFTGPRQARTDSWDGDSRDRGRAYYDLAVANVVLPDGWMRTISENLADYNI